MRLPLLHAVELPAALGDLRAEVRQFLAGERAAGRYTPRCDCWLVGFDERFSLALGQRGWIGTTFPKQYGGAGADPLTRFVIAEELLAAGAPVAADWAGARALDRRSPVGPVHPSFRHRGATEPLPSRHRQWRTVFRHRDERARFRF